MPAAARCTRRRFAAALGLGAWPALHAQPAATGPWVLVDDGHTLLQLHADTLAEVRRLTLEPRWTALLAGGAAPLGRGVDGVLQRPGVPASGAVGAAAAVASADGRWVCAVEGDALQLRSAALAPLRRWALPGPLAWLADAPRRRAFVLAFAARPELWQLSYDERAEDFYDGLVHDYRFGEGVPTRAFHNVRRMPLPEPLLRASLDGEQAELAGSGWVFNLDVRKRARLQPLLQPPAAGCAAPCLLADRPALAVPVHGEPRLDLFRCDDWERAASVVLPGPLDAALAHPAQAQLALWRLGGPLLLVHPTHGVARRVAGLERVRARPRWHHEGSLLWVLADDALLAVDPLHAAVRQTRRLDAVLDLA